MELEKTATGTEAEMKFEKATLDTKAIKSKYKKVYEIVSEIEPDGDIEGVKEIKLCFTKPSTGSFDRYIKGVSKNSMKAMTTLVQDNVIEEQQAELESLIEEYPALTLSLGEKLLAMLGLSKETNFKEL